MILACPSDQSLRAYAIGDINDELSEEIERHLGDCPSCEETVAQFDGADDTLIRHLPLAAGVAAKQNSAAPGWLARLRNGPPAEGVGEQVGGRDEPQRLSVLDAVGPEELAAYELLGVLGRGGMGVVYRARHRQLQRHVALKVLNPRLMATPEGIRRFEREIRILGGLRHAGIVMATDAGRVRGSAYLVMELVEGVDLSRLVKQGGPLTIAEACEAARQMAEALAAAHEAGAVHRDVKPSNAMIDQHGRVKLLDFGLARLAALSTQSLETSVGCLLGTLDYMAPEQADSEQPIDPRADFFGLGATLFYLLTGRPPRGGVQRSSLLQQLSSLAADAPRVSTLRRDIPPELDEFINRLLSRNPQERPESAREIAATLSKWAAGDLASRVLDFPKSADSLLADERADAQRSLSHLLGDGSSSDSRGAAVAASTSTQSGGDPIKSSGGRKWLWITFLAGLLATGSVLFGVNIVLQMQQGTLRIESEADNIHVEVVDEKDSTSELKIDRTGHETTLRAGRYRLRLAGQHDGLVLDQDTVTLTRGKETVARITRTPNRNKTTTTTTTSGTVPGKAKSHRDNVVLLCFMSNHNTACGAMVPILRKLREDGYSIREVNVETEQRVKSAYRVDSTPSFIVLDEGKEVRRVIGLTTEEVLRQSLGEESQSRSALLAADAPSSQVEKLYQGKTESEWQRMFVAETSPISKLEASRALFFLASELPAPRQLDRILEVAEEVARSGFGYEPLELAFAAHVGFILDFKKWKPTDSQNDLTKAFQRYNEELNEQIRQLPPETLAKGLCEALWGPSELKTALAHSLLTAGAVERIRSSPVAVKIVLTQLSRYPTDNRGALALLPRMRYLGQASQEERREIYASLDKLVGLNMRFPSPGFQRRLKDELISTLRFRDCVECQGPLAATAARLRLEEVVQRRSKLDFLYYDWHDPASQVAFQGKSPQLPYDPVFIALHRKQLKYLLGGWLAAANQYLVQHRAPPFDETTRDVTHSLDIALRLYSKDDTWPSLEDDTWSGGATPALLTAQLQTYYTQLPNDWTDQTANELLPASPAFMLTQIARITGEIPDFTLTGHPRSKPVARKLKLFEAFIAGEMTPQQQRDEKDSWVNLLNDAPYEVLDLSLKNSIKLDRSRKPAQFGRSGLLEPSGGIPSVLTAIHAAGPREVQADQLPLDAVLLVACLAHLAGRDEAVDSKIAELLSEPTFRQVLKMHLDNLFSGQLKCREHVRSSLQKMMKEAKSKNLMAAVAPFLGLDIPPEVKQSSTTSREVQPGWSPPVSKPSNSKAEIERLYQGKTEAELNQLFRAETSPLAKLQAGQALLSLAAELPAPQQIEKTLALQAELARAAYGEPSLEYAFAYDDDFAFDTSFAKRAQKWRTGPAALKVAEEQFHAALIGKLLVLSPEQLAIGLTRALVDGPAFQAANAHSLLTQKILPRIQAEPVAARIVLKELKRDYADKQRGELALLARAHYVQHATPTERREIFDSLDRLGIQLKEVPASGFRFKLKSSLLATLQFRRYPEGQKLGAATAARIVLEEMVQHPGEGKLWRYFTEPLGDIYRNSQLRQWLPPYFHVPHHGEDLRRSLNYLAPKWVEVANGYLKDRVRPPYDYASNDVLESLNLVLGLRADGDDWPVDKTAAILTEQLRNYYTNDPAATVDQSVKDLVPISPAMLLTQIIHITGEIPDFVRTGHPRPKSVAFRLKRWEHTLAGHEDKRLSTANLLNEAPYETIKRCVEENQKFDPAPKVGGSPLGAKTLTPPYDLLVSVQDDGVGSAPLGYIERDEPLLFLAVLADQTGKNDAQDDRIASLFAEDWMRENCWKQLEVLLASKYKARESARKILQKMAAKAKSKKLKDALNEFDFQK